MNTFKRGINMKWMILTLSLLFFVNISHADDYRQIGPVPVISAGVMTGTTALTSSSINVKDLSGMLVYCAWTGTPNGTFSIQGAIDDVAADYVDMGISVAAAAGSAGNRLVDINPSSVRFIRVVYTNTSSTGTLNCSESAKTF